jgi:hypothetical protein
LAARLEALESGLAAPLHALTAKLTDLEKAVANHGLGGSLKGSSNDLRDTLNAVKALAMQVCPSLRRRASQVLTLLSLPPQLAGARSFTGRELVACVRQRAVAAIRRQQAEKHGEESMDTHKAIRSFSIRAVEPQFENCVYAPSGGYREQNQPPPEGKRPAWPVARGLSEIFFKNRISN